MSGSAAAGAAGRPNRTVIAGYPWFTDWGRDTMIALPGLTLATGRSDEARAILRTFAEYFQEGLIPNVFSESQGEGAYNTADATLWFFHALDQYHRQTGDWDLVRELLPRLRESIELHTAGTRFGIHVDPTDGLLSQGEPGLQLTWMDAKVNQWVVTPRRGKAVEINALWYNALRSLEGWVRRADGDAAAAGFEEQAEQAARGFNERFWNSETGSLFDVVDCPTDSGELKNDPACRPNQLLAIALPHPVLTGDRWRPVLEAVCQRLLTPYGLRSLAPNDPAYQPRYQGNLQARDAAYHQGTVWAWLVGPFVDVWLAVYPGDRIGVRRLLAGLVGHLQEAALGTVSEVFDGEPPHPPRGCFAQAWSVAELLRCWMLTTEPASGTNISAASARAG